MVRAVLYCVPEVMPRSFLRPKMTALPIFTLHAHQR